jgi:hypothetical protein
MGRMGGGEKLKICKLFKILTPILVQFTNYVWGVVGHFFG